MCKNKTCVAEDQDNPFHKCLFVPRDVYWAFADGPADERDFWLGDEWDSSFPPF